MDIGIGYHTSPDSVLRSSHFSIGLPVSRVATNQVTAGNKVRNSPVLHWPTSSQTRVYTTCIITLVDEYK